MGNKSVMESLRVCEMQDAAGDTITSYLFIYCSALPMCQTQVLCFANIWTFLPRYFQSAAASIHRHGDHAYGEPTFKAQHIYMHDLKISPLPTYFPKRHISEYQKLYTRIFKIILFQTAKHIFVCISAMCSFIFILFVLWAFSMSSVCWPGWSLTCDASASCTWCRYILPGLGLPVRYLRCKFKTSNHPLTLGKKIFP